MNLPAGTVRGRDLNAVGSGPQDTWRNEPYTGPVQTDGRMVRIPLAGHAGRDRPDARDLVHRHHAPRRHLLDGDPHQRRHASATSKMRGDATTDDVRRSREQLDQRRLGRSSPSARGAAGGSPLLRVALGVLRDRATRTATVDLGPALDEDYFLVNPPQPGQRLIISTNATDGQIALALFAKSDLVAAGHRVRSRLRCPARPSPSRAARRASPPRRAATRPRRSSATRSSTRRSSRGDGTARGRGRVDGCRGRRADAAAGDERQRQPTLVAVLAARTLRRRAAPSRRARPYAPADPGPRTAPRASATHLTDVTNTLYLIDRQRFGETYGAAAVGQIVRARSHELDGRGTSAIEDGPVARRRRRRRSTRMPGCIAARTALDANPCSMSARADAHRRDQRLRRRCGAAIQRRRSPRS